MIVSMAKPNTHRSSKSKSRSQSKTKAKEIGNSYRMMNTSKSRSVPKQRKQHSMQPFQSNMQTIDEPAANIFNQNERGGMHSPPRSKIIKLKKKQRHRIYRAQDMKPSLHDNAQALEPDYDNMSEEPTGENQEVVEGSKKIEDIYDKPIMTDLN